MSSKIQDTILLIDGHALVHRAFHAIQRPLTLRSTGEDVRGVYGFAQMLFRAIQTLKPSHLAVAFDTPAPTFRSAIYSNYKANRTKTPPELQSQFPLVKELLSGLNAPFYELEGYEADDILGTLSAQATILGLKTIIMTGDSDLLQLVSNSVTVFMQQNMGKQTLYDPEKVQERYLGLRPEQIIDFKAICGDKSDNIPGVPGLGEKTVTPLLLKYGTLESIYSNIDQIAPKAKALLEDHRLSAFQGLELVTIIQNAPVNINIQESTIGLYDRTKAISVLNRLEFSSLVHRLPEENAEKKSNSDPYFSPSSLKYSQISEVKELELIKNACLISKKASIYINYTTKENINSKNHHSMANSLIGIAISTDESTAIYVALGDDTLDFNGDLSAKKKVIQDILELPDVLICFYNGNSDLTILKNNGFTITKFGFDVSLAAHLLGYKSIQIKDLTLTALGVELPIPEKTIGQPLEALFSSESNFLNTCTHADYTYRLWIKFEKELVKNEMHNLYHTIELPLVPIVVEMQFNGIKLDTHLLSELNKDFTEKLNKINQEIFDIVGHDFNLSSPKQLGEVLFDELQLQEKIVGISKPKKTKTGNYSTGATTLAYLESHHPIISLILRSRQLSKLKSTYIESLPKLVNPKTKRIHTIYNQSGSSTGRFSSSEPNLQNIPIRTSEGREIRRAFRTSNSNYKLVSADYSQIELRVLAHLSQDQNMIDTFLQELDIHASTASLIYNVSIDQVTEEMRRNAKVLNFGVAYGASAYGISQQTQLSIVEAAEFIEHYFAQFPTLKNYKDSIKNYARTNGYVETLHGRRGYIPDIASSNSIVRLASERHAINMTIQGTAAEILKLAMLDIEKKLKSSKIQSSMLLQIHDELVFEAPNNEIENLSFQLKRIMENVFENSSEKINFSVPLRVTIKTGDTLADLE
jgi:DNA polymerase-1